MRKVMDSRLSDTASRGRQFRHGLWLALCLLVSSAHAQTAATAPPLTLYELLDHASYFYPTLRAARVEARASNEDTSAIRRQRWPTVSVNTE
jgi:outer membrane protein TolC